MSKEATGENGAVLGSGEYWNRVNRAAFFGTLMQRPSETNYHETLREMGNRAGAAVEEIYDDLQEHINVIRGDAFDPVVHNAVMQIEDEELGENTVAEVLQKGYKKGDRILRHAVVKVANV